MVTHVPKSLRFGLVLALLAVCAATWADGSRGASLISLERVLESPGRPAAAAPAPADPADDLSTRLPQPDEILIQKSAQFPELGNLRASIQLSLAEIDELERRQGFRDFVVIGPEGSQVILRDDGVGGDPVAGDGLFSAIGLIDDGELTQRADEDAAATANSKSTTTSRFEGRVLVGTQEAKPFDADAFLAGQEVPFGPAVTFADETPGSVSAGAGEAPFPEGELLARVAEMFTPGTNAFQDRVLMITDPTVVTDAARTFDPCTNAGTPMGVWTFGHLMTEMANQAASGIDPSDLAEQWLNHWLSAQTVNSFSVPARLQMQKVIDNWRAASGGGALDLSIAPFRLLAIVSRLDLRKSTGNAGGYLSGAGGDKFLNAGEARFVFGLVTPPGQDGSGFIAPSVIPNTGGCLAHRFSVIFEYGVPKCECEEVRDWARQWVRLSTLPFPSATYNAALERITEQFARRNADPLKANGSALNQLRTNEVALAVPWQLREFRLTQIPFSFLTETTTADTAHDSFNNTVTFSNFVVGNIGSTCPPFTPPPVPLLFSGSPFLGGNPQVPGPPVNFHWNGPAPLNAAGDPCHDAARFATSFAACNGCHARDTDTIFVHVSPMTPGLPATLSGFLTGISVTDPVSGTVRDFDDLERREKDIKRLSKVKCFRFHRVNIDHVRRTLAETRRLPVDLFEGLQIEPVEQRLSVALDELLRDPILQSH